MRLNIVHSQRRLVSVRHLLPLTSTPILSLTPWSLQEGIKEQDKTLINIFQKVQGDVKELNTFVSNHRSSSSLPGTPAAPQVQPQTK